MRNGASSRNKPMSARSQGLFQAALSHGQCTQVRVTQELKRK
jgi:hypothetical protein